MSRIGKKPVPVPKGVTVTLNGQDVKVKGPKGELSFKAVDHVVLSMGEDGLSVQPRDNGKLARSMWGMSRTMINNMVTGVSQGFVRQLEINGVGYRAAVQGKNLQLQLGYSHDVLFPIPQGIDIKCEKPTAITISGIDRQLVGHVAAKIRGYRPPEPYKGKGVKYAEEKIFRKEGKKK